MASSSSPPAPAPSGSPPDAAWYGNIQYLANISILGAVCCLVLFLVVKLRSDHRLPGVASLAAKLVAVWHTTGQQIARLCGANSAQYLSVEGYTFITFGLVSIAAVLLVLPINLYVGVVPIDDQFARATIVHVPEGSRLLWFHVGFMLVVTAAVHYCITKLETRLQATRFHDADSVDSVAVFTLMVRGLPRPLAMDKSPLEDYFEHKYPGKIFSVVVPSDLDGFYRLKSRLLKTRQELVVAHAKARLQQQLVYQQDYFFDYEDRDAYVDLSSVSSSSCGWSRLSVAWSSVKERMKSFYECLLVCCRLTPEDSIRRLEARRLELENAIEVYREGRANGAGIAFVVFKDVFTASRALQDARGQSRAQRRASLSTMVESQLWRGHWKVSRAPSPRDIYWQHLGRSTIERRVRTVVVNMLLLLLLFFCSSPLAAITAFHNASRFISKEAMNHVQIWLAWARSSSWVSAFILQFLPNVLIFLTMYVVVPAVLSHLSKFESHLTVSGEQQAVLVKTVCFFLVNLILLKALVESTLEAALMHIGQCYVDMEGCKSIKQLMSATFLSTSCLSALAFLITSSLLGVSFDLLAPIPWIKRKFMRRRYKHLLFANSAAAGASEPEGNGLHEELLRDGTQSEDDTVPPIMQNEVQDRDLSVYPLAKDLYWGVQPFDYAQYYAFNLTIFALVVVYSTFAPVVVAFGALYFGYRYMVDKYNFLFVYRVRGAAATNDGKLMGTVLRVMRLSLCLYLVAMLLFFYARGDAERLQLLTTLALLMVVCAKYGIEKLVSPPKDSFDLSIIQGLRTVDEVVEGPEVEYEMMAKPNFDGL